MSKMEKLYIHPEGLQNQKFLPHPHVQNTGRVKMQVSKALQKARKAKEKIDYALSERDTEVRSLPLREKNTRSRSSSDRNDNQSSAAAKQARVAMQEIQRNKISAEGHKRGKGRLPSATGEEQQDEGDEMSDASSERERVLKEIPHDIDVYGDDDSENVSDTAEDSEVGQEKQTEDDTASEDNYEDDAFEYDEASSEKLNEKESFEDMSPVQTDVDAKKSHSKTQASNGASTKPRDNDNTRATVTNKIQANSSVLPQLQQDNKNKTSLTGNTTKQNEFFVLRESRISSSSDTDSSLDKNLHSVNSDPGSSISNASERSPVPQSNSASSTEEEKKLDGTKLKSNTEAGEDDEEEDDNGVTASSSNETQESNSDVFMDSPRAYPAVDPETLFMENPWLAHVYQRFSRPKWDSSPYRPSCNRPAWDETLYEEAKERFKRHEAVKMHGGNMFEFPWCPALVNGGMDAPFFNMNRLQKTYFQFGSVGGSNKMARYVQTGSKIMGNRMNGQQQHAKKILPYALNDLSGGNKSVQNNLSSINNNNNNSNPAVGTGSPKKDYMSAISPASKTSTDNNLLSLQGKLSVSTNPLQKSMDNNSNNNNNNNSSRISFSNKSSFSETNQRSRSLPKRDSPISWRVPQSRSNNSNNIRNQKLKNEQLKQQQQQRQQNERPRVMNPLPRVAYLTKSSIRRTSNGGFHGIQVLDERGRPKNKWDPSPWISIGKKSAWDDTNMIEADYYRLKYFGWT